MGSLKDLAYPFTSKFKSSNFHQGNRSIGNLSGAYKRNLTFSGCDIKPVVYGLDSDGNPQLYVVGDIATITYSVHQDKGAVRTLGRSSPRGYVKGGETVAGTMIFNVFEKQALFELTDRNRDVVTKRTQHMHRLPPFDILLYFSNEAGHEASLGIFGIEIIDEGQSHSVEDTYVETTCQYVARHVQPLEPRNGGGLFSESNKARFEEGQKIAQKALGPGETPFNYSYIDAS